MTAELAGETGRPHLRVEGTAELVVEPNTGIMHLEVAVQEKQAAAARQKCAARLADILGKLRALDLPGLEIETDHVRLAPVGKDGDRGYIEDMVPVPRKITGYRATQDLSLTVTGDKEALSEGISRIIDTTANWTEVALSGPTWMLDDAQEAQLEALRGATRDAVARAEAMAEAAGVEIAEVLYLGTDEVGGMGSRGGYMPSPPACMSLAPCDVATDVEVANINIRASVQLTAAIRPAKVASDS